MVTIYKIRRLNRVKRKPKSRKNHKSPKGTAQQKLQERTTWAHSSCPAGSQCIYRVCIVLWVIFWRWRHSTNTHSHSRRKTKWRTWIVHWRCMKTPQIGETKEKEAGKATRMTETEEDAVAAMNVTWRGSQGVIHRIQARTNVSRGQTHEGQLEVGTKQRIEFSFQIFATQWNGKIWRTISRRVCIRFTFHYDRNSEFWAWQRPMQCRRLPGCSSDFSWWSELLFNLLYCCLCWLFTLWASPARSSN